MKNQWRLFAGIALILIILLFAVINVDDVPVNFGFTVVNGPLIIVIFVSLLMGSLITLLVATASTNLNRKEVKELRHKMSHQDEEIEKAVNQSKADYEARLAEMSETIAKQDKKIQSLEEELIQQLTSQPGAAPQRNSDVQPPL